ncbi:MAG: hypothetical protein OXN17_01380 [Candidatus Poribacteria bacterium]|nr:hypothetical protein [Candidatus Poribacteria bacterium]MDE0502968.1 hypothetical protein [Candidatus Poribacteria bacterium]
MEKTQIESLPVINASHLKSADAAKLPLLLQHMLDMADRMFGRRDESFSVTGIAFWERRPKIHFPKGYEGKEIEIKLQIVTSDAEEKCMRRARYQLAHETIHLLCPVLVSKATFLEEGVACYFAEYYVKREWNDIWYPGEAKYDLALCLAKTLLKEEIEYYPGRRFGIKNLRSGEGGPRKFGDITDEELIDAFPHLAAKDAHRLTTLFESDED